MTAVSGSKERAIGADKAPLEIQGRRVLTAVAVSPGMSRRRTKNAKERTKERKTDRPA
jgi:hypothetical protein